MLHEGRSVVGLHYRWVFDPDDPTYYAPWVRALKGRNGVYAIRDAETGEVLYVGESHTKRLYATLTRHFQSWDGYTAGTTYDRFAVEVATCALDSPRGDVIREQVAVIGRLSPYDNVHHQQAPTDWVPDADLDELTAEDFKDDW